MKYPNFMGEDVDVNMMNQTAEVTKSSLDVSYARSAMDVFDKDGGAPCDGISAIHDYRGRRRSVNWRVGALANGTLQAFDAFDTHRSSRRRMQRVQIKNRNEDE